MQPIDESVSRRNLLLRERFHGEKSGTWSTLLKDELLKAHKNEVDELRKENAKLQDLLAKERYRIKHLIRAIEAK